MEDIFGLNNSYVNSGQTRTQREFHKQPFNLALLSQLLPLFPIKPSIVTRKEEAKRLGKKKKKHYNETSISNMYCFN